MGRDIETIADAILRELDKSNRNYRFGRGSRILEI